LLGEEIPSSFVGTWSASGPSRSKAATASVSSWQIDLADGLLTMRDASPTRGNPRETRCKLDGTDTSFVGARPPTVSSTYRCRIRPRSIEVRGSLTIAGLPDGQSQNYNVQQTFELTKDGTLRVSDHIFATVAGADIDVVSSKDVFQKAVTPAARVESGVAPPQMPPVAASNQHLRDGMASYMAHDYKKAIPDLQGALSELKTAAGFEGSVMWRVLVDNLGMAYGVSGDLKTAKATFDYGVSKDSTYPMFHYNLACTFAEMGDRDTTIQELTRAFALKANANPGEPMPNPGTDDSFRRFMKDATFQSVLKEIQTESR
jgi:hypothetical protein